jgi:hypothetical protein
MMPSIPILGAKATPLSYIHLAGQSGWKRYLDGPSASRLLKPHFRFLVK